ncbi:stalk domain-containing protein [Crassaminicella profunda]|uniref:stalk domain-containing protein n=1 Tax=Crassaminicella profunda TaxID=1286698 RepID=UPI001CA6B381|nr:stalk domain-containing protein [Crassaminicella profunda]QZY55496.1 TolC family protein [Crassaminicella profunda]
MNKRVRKMACVISITVALSWNTVAAQEMINLPVEISQSQTAEIQLTIGEANYKVDNNVKTLKVASYIKGEAPLIPLDFIAEITGINSNDMEWNDKNDTVTIFKDNRIIQLTTKDSNLIVDGAKFDLGVVPEVKDGTMMVPYHVIEKISDIKAKWNSVTKTIKISVKKQSKEEVASGDYTYESLLTKALKNSDDLQKAELMVTRADYVKDDANDAIDYTPAGTRNGAADAKADGIYTAYKSSEIGFEKAKKNVKTLRETIAYQVKNGYYDVLKKEDNKKVAKLQLEIKNENKEQSQLKYELGVVSELQNKQAKRDCEDAKKAYDLSVKELEKSYETLNHVVGFDLKERYTLKDEISFEKIKDEDVDSHILGVMNESPEIWGVEKDKELADLGVKFYTFNAGNIPYEAKKIDAKAATMNINSKKEAYEKNLRASYNSLKQLEDQYEKDLIAYEKAKDDLETAKLQLEIGNIAPIQLKSANLQLEVSKKQLRERTMSYNMLAVQYNKPWVVSAFI